MELKNYQQEVLADLRSFIEQLRKTGRLDTAFSAHWSAKGVSLAAGQDFVHPYNNHLVPRVPNVTAKVPTAGGKTFLACNALKTIFDLYPEHTPRAVAWFVPSDTILTQTLHNLSNPLHPYRRKLNSLFNNRVRVIDKAGALMGEGISPTEMREQLTIFVLSVQSFIERRRGGQQPLSYRENSNLDYGQEDHIAESERIAEAERTSLIQYLARQNPLVVVDESHNFGSDLRLDMLQKINPFFIFDLTATPHPKTSNVVSFIDAMKLKRANMVKLPVVVYNQHSKEDVVANAISLQRSLEAMAREQHANGGRYIRPIVLLQAEPKTDGDTKTFDKLKADLLALGIPEHHIKIKTANKNELKGIDLLSEACDVRYIITVNALKEGWDCPFAYVLATVANRSSRVDVEQIVGRILRLPYTEEHAIPMLNCSYVLTCSNAFQVTVENIVKALNNAGFSSRNYYDKPKSGSEYVVTYEAETPHAEEPLCGMEQEIPFPEEPQSEAESDTFDIEKARDGLDHQSQAEAKNIMELAQRNIQAYNQRMNEAEAAGNDFFAPEIESHVKRYPLKDRFADQARSVRLPNFVVKEPQSSLFGTGGSYRPLSAKEMLKDFDISQEDTKVDFSERAEIIGIDLSERQTDEYVPTIKKISTADQRQILRMFEGLSQENKQKQLAERFAKDLNADNTLRADQLLRYLHKVLESKNADELSYLYENYESAMLCLKRKIESLKTAYADTAFQRKLDTNEIECIPDYAFPEQLDLQHPIGTYDKTLYTEEEGDLNDLEKQVARILSTAENVVWWHRNLGRGRGFCINGYLKNHYPDFIAMLKNGIVVVVESKGDHLANDDSRYKNNIGRIWANQAGRGYKYFMVFENNSPLNNTYTLNEFEELLQQFK